MADPSGTQSRAGGLRLLLLAALVAGGIVVAAGLAPQRVRSLVPGLGALVARAWSAAAPQPMEVAGVTRRLSAAEARALAGEADEAWQRGDWALVAERLTTLAAAVPRTREHDDRLYEAELNLGWGLLGVGEHSEAEAHLAHALAIRPSAPEALEGLRMARQPAPARSAALEPAAQVAVSQAPAPAQAVSGESVIVTVQPGDTLFALARRFGTTVEAIKVANGLPCSTILAGQKLVIPLCVPVCPAPRPVPVVCLPVCPSPTPVCVPVAVPVIVCVPVCVPICPPVVCVPVCPPAACVPICPTPVCVPIDP